MSNSPSNPTNNPAPGYPPYYAAVPMPSFSVSPVKDFLLKSAIFSMSLASLLLTAYIVWNGLGTPKPVVNPTPIVNPLPVVNPTPGPGPVPNPLPPPVNPLPSPSASSSVTLANPGMNIVKVTVGDKLTAVVVNVVPAGSPLTNPNDIYPGTYPVTATVDSP